MAGQEAGKSGGLMDLLIPLALVTLLGGGGGYFLGFSVLAQKESAGSGPTKSEAQESGKHVEAGDHGSAKAAHGSASGHGKAEAEADGHDHGDAATKEPDKPESLQVKELPPIVTNLAVSRNWVRLQTAIAFDPHELAHAETLIPELMSDLTAFINTLDLRDIEGPDGLRRLREELNERARIRSDHHVRELIVESLVIQ